MTVLGNQRRLYNKHLCLSIQEVLPEHLLPAKPWAGQYTTNTLDTTKKRWIQQTNVARGLAWHPPSRQCGVSTRGKPGVITAVCEYSGGDCGHISGARHIALREQVCAARLNAHSVPRRSEELTKAYVENFWDGASSLLCPANVFTSRSNTISSMKPLLVDSLGKLAISSSAPHISLFIPFSQG